MRQHVRHAARATEFDIVMDRMIVTARGLEGEEDGVGHGSARQDEFLADGKILEPACLVALVLGGVESVIHVGLLAGLVHKVILDRN